MLKTNGLRPEVLAFAHAMERKLRAHDADRGTSWKHMTPDEAVARLREEVDELDRVGTDAEILSEAADVANFAMFVADVCHALPTLRGDGRAQIGMMLNVPLIADPRCPRDVMELEYGGDVVVAVRVHPDCPRLSPEARAKAHQALLLLHEG